ncbi:MAG TPA: PadR family transcriptional regulator [Acidobacteriaceae bacterium]|jgi:DNA-binding PadR family transcriptional regulator|nr:PadR family transcriptional regulator [Acidobacteriaceae bacterium]
MSSPESNQHAASPDQHLPLTPAVFAILLALAAGEKHGYAIMKEASLPAGGGIKLGPGTLYGTVDRLMRDGLVEETGFTDDDRRRYYRLTELGARVLAAEISRLSAALRSARARVTADEVRA